MTKIVKSLSVVAFVGTIALGLTGAYFSDEEPIEDNIFQAGVLDIQQGANDLGTMTLAGLAPGVATDPQRLEMGNNGELDAIIDKISVTNWAESDSGSSTPNISAGDYAKKVNVTISDEIGRPLWKDTLYNLHSSFSGNAIDGTDRVFLAKKGSGENYTTRDYWFTFELDSSVNNDYQGEGIDVDFSVNATQVKDDKFDAAERLVDTRNNDGGWDWEEDGFPTNPSSVSLFGVTATGLLRAYEFSGNSDYFDAAEDSAYEIANGWCANYDGVKANCTSGNTGRTSWEGGGGYTNEDILFLQRMGKYWNAGNLFSTKAEQAVIDRWDAYDNDAQKVYDFIEALRASGSPDYFYWDLMPIVEHTLDASNTVSDSNQAMVLRNNALDLAALVAADQHSTGGYFITSWGNRYSRVGQSSAVQILQLADNDSFDIDYSTEIAAGVVALLAQQESDGSFKGGDDSADKSIQTTAYCALALEIVGDHTNAQRAVDYIESQQLSNGGWYGKGTTTEYPEINSEALRAIISVNQ